MTTSKVEQAYQKDEGRLIQTNMPVLPGNDGAPVFSSRGELVGFAVYGLSYCPDQQCFANGTVRSSNELLNLLDEKNVKLDTQSASAMSWRGGVDQFFNANYAASEAGFNGAQYVFNRWAAPLEKLASSLKGSSKDTSLMNQLLSAATVLLAVSGLLTVLLTVLYVIHRRNISRLQVGLYGVQAKQSVPESHPQPGVSTMPQEPLAQLPQVPPVAPPVVNQMPPVSQQQPLQPTPPQSSTTPEDPFYK